MKTIRRIISIMLVIIFAICIAGCRNNGNDVGTSTTPTTVATTVKTSTPTAQATTIPATTAQATTIPATTVQATTIPATTAQATTLPATTVAPATAEQTTASTEPTEESTEESAEEPTEEATYSQEKYGVFVDISAQELRYYEYGEVILTSPIVTGMSYSTPTPTGEFYIVSKARNIDLCGDNYSSHVDYWMAFLGSGYGFHDASWRDSFGGDIYLYDGSHGCVNMPLEKVAELYTLVKIGTPVFIS